MSAPPFVSGSDGSADPKDTGDTAPPFVADSEVEGDSSATSPTTPDTVDPIHDDTISIAPDARPQSADGGEGVEGVEIEKTGIAELNYGTVGTGIPASPFGDRGYDRPSWMGHHDEPAAVPAPPEKKGWALPVGLLLLIVAAAWFFISLLGGDGGTTANGPSAPGQSVEAPNPGSDDVRAWPTGVVSPNPELQAEMDAAVADYVAGAGSVDDQVAATVVWLCRESPFDRFAINAADGMYQDLLGQTGTYHPYTLAGAIEQNQQLGLGDCDDVSTVGAGG